MAPFFEECRPGRRSKRPIVRVAILDTGIDRTNAQISEEWDRIEYKSCLKNDESGEEDLHGHGTHIAGLILRIARNVKLYVFRVAKDNKFSEENIDAIASVRKTPRPFPLRG